MNKLDFLKKVKKQTNNISIDVLRVYPLIDEKDSTTYAICEWIERKQFSKNYYLTKIKVISTGIILNKTTFVTPESCEYKHDSNCPYYLEGRKSLKEMLDFLEIPIKNSYTIEELIELEKNINYKFEKECYSIKKILKN